MINTSHLIDVASVLLFSIEMNVNSIESLILIHSEVSH